MMIGDYIKNELNEFYSKNLKEKDCDFELSTDDYVVIFIYLISKSNLKSIVSHCNLIERFIDYKTLEFCNEYSFFLFRACVDYFQEIKF